ncbi:MAG: hypothetical protein L3K14_00920 [Thermoplasmata archaeon]|nr:hypothetical protein [Thermoplasmata archaeon]
MWWDELVVILNALAIPALVASIVGVYLHYFYSDKAKRQEFRRNALYERKLAAYRAILSTARSVAELFAWIMRWHDPEKTVGAQLTNVAPEKREEVTKGLVTMLTLFRDMQFQGILKRTGWKPGVMSLPGFKAFSSEVAREPEVRSFLEFIELALIAQHELEAAVTDLKLLGCPKNLTARVDSLMEQIMKKSPSAGSQGEVTSDMVDQFEEDVKEHLARLVAAMNADLEVTMGGPV